MAWYSDIFKPEPANQPAINAEDYLRFKDEYGREPRQGEMPTENIAPASYLAGQVSGSSIAGGVPGPRYGSIITGKKVPGVSSGEFIPSAGPLYSAKQKVPYVYGDLEKLPITPEGPGTGLLNTKTGVGAYAPLDHLHADVQNQLFKGGVSPQEIAEMSHVRWNPWGTIDIMPRNLPEKLSPVVKARIEERDFRTAYDMLGRAGMIPKNADVMNRGYYSGTAYRGILE
jgi:hypothetical protein